MPDHYLKAEIKPFSLQETKQHAEAYFREFESSWLEDFYRFTGGNPRVQRYALEFARTANCDPLEVLRPKGKSLEQVFSAQIKTALKKSGDRKVVQDVLAALVVLPRPIPVTEIAAIVEMSPELVKEICLDLAPGVRIDGTGLGFADEDFEYFAREKAQTEIASIQRKTADHFWKTHQASVYAATHVAKALFAVSSYSEIKVLVETYLVPKVILDPILLRKVTIERLKIAVKICSDRSNAVDSVMTLLIGAEALKSDAALRNTLIYNPDLTAEFCHVDTVQAILREPAEVQHHGPIICHSMAFDAKNGKWSSR